MIFDRRTCLAGLAALPAALTRGARAAPGGGVIMATWGGNTARMWRETFAAPFSSATGIPAMIAEVPDPATAIIAAQGRPQHNVIIAASYQAANLAERGLIEELTPADIPNIARTPETYWLKSGPGKLLGMPTSFIYYGIAYNRKIAAASDFASWEALGDPRWKGKLSIGAPLFVGPYDLTLFAKLAGGDEDNIQPGIGLLERVARNAVSSYSSMASFIQQLSIGEVSAAPFYSSQVQLLRQAGPTDIDLTLPREGGMVLPYVLAIPKSAPDREAALRFLNDCIAPEKQITAARSGYLPLTDGASLPKEVEASLGMGIEEVRRRNWSPDWFKIGRNLNDRVRIAQRVLDASR